MRTVRAGTLPADEDTMADQRTQITELGTAAGILLGDDHHRLELLDALDLPGIPETVWRPPLEAAAEDWHQHHKVLRASLANGAAFRASVLGGRDPQTVEWRGGSKAMWVSDAPVDLRVNDVYLISAKYDSVCLLNRAPAAVFDHLLAAGGSARNPHWFETVAPVEYQLFFEALIDALVVEGGADRHHFPATPAELTKAERVHLKYVLKPWTRSLPGGAADAYRSMCAAVSTATADRWKGTLNAASDTVKLGMVAQMIRLSGSVYWLLGQSGDRPVRCRVGDAASLRSTYRLARFDVELPASVGQPRVDWTAHLEPRRGVPGEAAVVVGFCEIRWSHGKFQGHPECKVQLRTPVWQLPGYTELAGRPLSLFD
jgi:hypothetical protein